MDVEKIFEVSGIPILVGVVCLYYGIRVWLLGDLDAIRGKNKPPVRDQRAYAILGGRLIIVLGIFAWIMAVLLFLSVYAAVIEAVVGFILFAFGWKRMDEKYGSL